jgi:hypothetical protein
MGLGLGLWMMWITRAHGSSYSSSSTSSNELLVNLPLGETGRRLSMHMAKLMHISLDMTQVLVCGCVVLCSHMVTTASFMCTFCRCLCVPVNRPSPLNLWRKSELEPEYNTL